MQQMLKILPLLLALAVMLSCQKAPTIDRVGTDAIAKAYFDGEWYQKATIVDKHFNHAATFVGNECGFDKVHFEVTKNALKVYRSYERASGVGGAAADRQKLMGEFAVVKHFTPEFEVNLANGIENNVRIENEAGRSWRDHSHIRINWKENLVADPQCNDWFRSMTFQNITQVSGEVLSDPFKFRKETDYFETTIEAVAEPSEALCASIGDWNCNTASLKIKYSYMKVDINSTYEARDYPDSMPLRYGTMDNGAYCVSAEAGCKDIKKVAVDGATLCDEGPFSAMKCAQKSIPLFSQFGFFRTEQISYDRTEGFRKENQKKWINRWDTWRSSRTEDGRHIPLALREPKPIIYYTNVGFPDDLRETTKEMADDWAQAFANTVSDLKTCSLEYVTTYADFFNLWPAMEANGFALPTESSLEDTCQFLAKYSTENALALEFFVGDKDALKKRYGKLFQVRENDCNIGNVRAFIAIYDLSKKMSAGGFGEVNADKLRNTCSLLESVSASSENVPKFVWQTLGDLRFSLLTYFEKAELSGPLGYGPSSADPTTGEIVSATANIYGASLDTYAAWGADIVQYLNEEKVSISLDSSNMLLAHIASGPSEYYAKSVEEGISRLSPSDKFIELSEQDLHENWDKLSGSSFEREWLLPQSLVFNPEVSSSLRGNWARLQMPEETRLAHKIRALNAGGLDGSQEEMLLSRIGQKFLEDKGYCFFTDVTEPAVFALAKELRGKTWDEAFTLIRANIFRSVAAHEIGHTLGLRHNFEGGADALNYFPNFWDVDTHDHRMAKVTSRKEETRYSSIMDYAQRFNSDWAGIGLYDKAAIKFGYGNLVEVFDESEGEFVPKILNKLTTLFHYQDLPAIYAGGDSEDQILQDFMHAQSAYFDGDMNSFMDVQALGIEGDPNNFYKRRTISLDAYYRSEVLKALDGVLKAQHKMGGAGGDYEAISQESFQVVPYRFCTDGHVGSNYMCGVYKLGSSAEELVDNTIEEYENYYKMRSFRRDKIAFSPERYMSGLYRKTYKPLLQSFQFMYFRHDLQSRIFPFYRDLMRASEKGLNFFARVLQTVEPGDYCLEGDQYLPMKDTLGCDKPIHVGIDQGRHLDTRYADGLFGKPDYIGNVYDKLLAMVALSDDVGTFQGSMFKKDTHRASAFSAGYYRIHDKEITKMFMALSTGDLKLFSPRISMVGGAPKVEYRTMGELQGITTSDSETLILPSFSRDIAHYAAVIPMVNLTRNSDFHYDYAQRARVVQVGSDKDVYIDPSVKQIIFVHPENSLLQFRATAARGEDMSPGYQLLKRAKSFVGERQPDGTVSGVWWSAKDALDKISESSSDTSVTQDQEAAERLFGKAQKGLAGYMRQILLTQKMSDEIL